MSKKNLLTAIISLTLVAVISVGATLAYMSVETDSITNNFVFSADDTKINGSLSENFNGAVYEAGETPDDVKMMPGSEFQKEAVVTVDAGSIEAFAFLKVTTTTDFLAQLIAGDTKDAVYFTSAFAPGSTDKWQLLETTTVEGVVTQVYWQKVASSETDTALAGPFNAIKFDTSAKGFDSGEITFKAGLIQTDNFTADTDAEAAALAYAGLKSDFTNF